MEFLKKSFRVKFAKSDTLYYLETDSEADSNREQHSESYTDLTNLGTRRDYDMNSNLSRSLQNIVDVPSQQSNRESEKDKSKHRFERISYQKHLSNRTREKSTLDRQGTKRQNTMVKENSVLTETEAKKAAINKLQKDSLEQIQKRIGTQNGNINGVKQYVYVKDLRKDNSVHIYQNSLSSITTASTVKRKSQENASNDRPESKTSPHTFKVFNPTNTEANFSPSDITKYSDTVTLTPDGATARSPAPAFGPHLNSDNEL